MVPVRPLPDGDPVPGRRSPPGRPRCAGSGSAPLGVYVHVPFCSVRCGYCDFNTYTATELGGGASRAAYAEQAVARGAARPRACSATAAPPVATVFFGGGTPTLLPPADLVAGARARSATTFGLAAGRRGDHRGQPGQRDAPTTWPRWPRAGSPGSPSACSPRCRTVLAVLDRTHDPERVPRVVEWARAAGIEQVSLDLIYGTPGESVGRLAALARRRAGLRARPRLGVLPDRRGRHRAGPPGALAGWCRCPTTTTWPTSTCSPTRRSSAAGLGWYEVSNWARRRGAPAASTTGSTGPAPTGGASARARTPTSAAPAGGTSSTPRRTPAGSAPAPRPAQAREVLDAETRRVERVLLEVRLAEGLPLDVLDPAGRRSAVVAGGLAEVGASGWC